MAKKFSFLEHLEELRSRIIKIILSIGALSLFFFMFGLKEYDLHGVNVLLPLTPVRMYGINLYVPYFDINDNIASYMFTQIKADLLPENVELIMVRPIDALMANLQISLFMGLTIGMPIIVYQLGKFVSPALYPREKKMIMKTIVPATVLFITGALFSYFLMIPFFINFLYSYGYAMDVRTFLSINEFISFTLILMVGFGFIFELPVFMVGLTAAGLVEPRFWKDHWRGAVIIMIVIGGIITPDASGITQMMVAVPMMILYLVGYLISNRVHKKKLLAEAG